MNKKTLSLAIVILIIIIAIFILQNPFRESAVDANSNPNVGLTVGKLAPNFELQTPEGETVSLKQFRGDKAVVLNFWASWCPFCIDEMPFFQKYWKENEDEVIVLGVNLQEDKETAERFAKEVSATYPILLDPNSDVTDAYNVRTQPTTYFINNKGVIVDRRLGPLSEEEVAEKTSQLIKSDVKVEIPTKDDDIKTLPDGTRYIIHPSKLRSGGPPKDGIPSIDDPKFVKASEADFLSDDDLVVGLESNGVVKAYPFSILVWHEIVNDFFGDQAILVTYCPLCGTAIAFDRTIDNEAVEFGVSGLLFNSNLVMYDRKTDTLWNQVGARAIVGELTGSRLKLVPANTVTWKEWKQENPNTLVLSQDTGFTRSYGRDPYGNYYISRGLYFPVEKEDDRLDQKAVIYGVELNGKFKAYPDEKLKKGETIEDTLGGTTIQITRDNSNIIEIKDTATGEIIPFERHFWFSWFAFNPDTELYE